MKKWSMVSGSILAVAFIGGAIWYTVLPKNARVQDAVVEDSLATDSTAAMYASMTGDTFDKAYIGDMIAHHQGALNMAGQAVNVATKVEIRTLANQILESQAAEIRQLMAWQQEWGGIASDDPHAYHINEMSSAMSSEMQNMERKLEGLTGEAYNKEFLNQMILHHQQAIEMSRYAATNAERREIKSLAEQVIEAQQKEVTDMKRWQLQWGY